MREIIQNLPCQHLKIVKSASKQSFLNKHILESDLKTITHKECIEDIMT